MGEFLNREKLGIRSQGRGLRKVMVEDWAEYQASDGRRWAPRWTLLLAGGVSLVAWVMGGLAVIAFR